MPTALSWIEVDHAAIEHNLKQFRNRLPAATQLLAVVKGNAYGHGIDGTAAAALRAGADWLGVFNLEEGLTLRQAGVEAPILLLGYVPRRDLREAVEADLRLTVASLQTLQNLTDATAMAGKKARLHLKIETGTHRMGFAQESLPEALERIANDPRLELEGAHTHFANIEDTTEHGFAGQQLEHFRRVLATLRQRGFAVSHPHAACSAAAILFPETYFSMVRVGIGAYGLWPSKETYVSSLEKGREPLRLEPAMTWKTIVAQVKRVPKGAYVGYGCTFRATRDTLIAALPVGYVNGYDRLLSNRGHVLIRGMRAPIRGRVCMNLTMVDVTDIDGVCQEDEVVLLGKQGDEQITAEQIAGWAQTINYEVVARADPGAPRIEEKRPVF